MIIRRSVMFFFFKQKTAYEMRISDWSSDVCSSDLGLGRPVLFTQTRAGRNGRPFRLVKFRTMTDARDRDGRLLPDAERLTRLGRFLRHSRVDELPELWNILMGDMRLVGPRPLLPDTVNDMGSDGLRSRLVGAGITRW